MPDHDAYQRSVGLMVVLRFAGLTAALRFAAPYMVGVPTMADTVPMLVSQRGLRLGRLPVRLRLRATAMNHPTPTTTLLLPALVVCRISCKCAAISLCSRSPES